MLNRRDELSPLAPGRHGESLGFHSHFQDNIDDPLDILIDLGSIQTIDRIAIFPASTVFQGETIAGYGFPHHFRIEISKQADFKNAILVHSSEDPKVETRPEYPEQIKLADLSARFIRLRVLKHWLRVDDRILTAFSEIMVLSGGRNVAIGAEVIARSFISLPAWSSDNLVDGQTDLGLPIKPEPSESNGYLSRPSKHPNQSRWIQLDLEKPTQIEEIRLYPTQPLDAPSQYGHGFPRRFRVLAAMNPDLSDSRVIADFSDPAFPNPGDNPVFIPGDGLPANHVRIEADELWHIAQRNFAVALSEMQVFENGKNVAGNANAVSSHPWELSLPYRNVWKLTFLTDGYSSQNKLIGLDEWLDNLEERKTLDQQIAAIRSSIRQTTDSTIAGVLILGALFVVSLLTLILVSIVRRRKLVLDNQRALRSRISRDLHDDLGSRLSGMRLISETLLNEPNLPKEVRDEIEIIFRASGEANDAMRDIVWLLDTRESSRVKLVRHMRQIVPSVLVHIKHHFQTNEVPEQNLDFEFRRQILFSFKECLGNIVKHADAHNVYCYIGGDEKRFTFEVRDDGKGFDLEAVSAGHGLQNLQTRASSIEGQLQIQSAPGEGTRVLLDTPIRLSK